MNTYISLFCGLTLFISITGSAATPDFYAGFRDLPPTIDLYHYKVPDAILRAEFEASMKKSMQEAKNEKSGVNTAFFVLPQLYVFDREGHEIVDASLRMTPLTL